MTTTPQQSSSYIHGTDPEEQLRLGLMNQILNERSLAELDPKKGDRVLDLGCGTGLFSRLIAQRTGTKVLAIERSEAQLAVGRADAEQANQSDLCDFRQGDALDLQLDAREWGSFDVTHTRFLLEHLPDPLAAVTAMVRATRPGGRIILEDDDHDVLRLWPEPAGFATLWQAYMRSYDRLGNDPIIGRRLVQLLREAGAEPVRAHWIFFGGCAGEPIFPVLLDNLIGILVGAKDTIVEHKLFDAAIYEEVINNLRAWGRRDDAAFWYSMAWAEGRKQEE